jgi:predicted nuclease of predicted toxin-antitoxin system
VKLLLDANISRRLVALLLAEFPGTIHASILGPDPDDDVIWDYAKAHDFVIVSKDSDFYRMSAAWGAPPKVVWLRIGNGRTRQVAQLLNSNQAALEAFALDETSALLIIEP